MTEIKENYGIVVLMDALGMQNATIPESMHFINFLKDEAEGVSLFLSGSTESSELREHFEKIKPIVRTFGDTFLITWSIPSESNIKTYLEAISFTVAVIICNGIDKGILVRGALSIGQYLESDTTIIGPVITDAASWHEQADWFGCITTPNCTQHVNSLSLEGETFDSLIEYKVPLKSKKQIKLWCVDWPFIMKGVKEVDPLKWYYKSISKLPIPLGVENKYINTEVFIKYCSSRTT